MYIILVPCALITAFSTLIIYTLDALITFENMRTVFWLGMLLETCWQNTLTVLHNIRRLSTNRHDQLRVLHTRPSVIIIISTCAVLLDCVFFETRFLSSIFESYDKVLAILACIRFPKMQKCHYSHEKH